MTPLVLRAIDERFASGATLDEIERDLLADFPEETEDERSALWLYAWHRSPQAAYHTEPDLAAASLAPLD